MLERYIDPIEILRRRQFTILHQIVLGLSGLDLRSQLDQTTSEIDVKDSIGRTPLHWAVQQSNIPAIEALLEYGATLDILAERGFSIFDLLRTRGDDNTAVLALLLGAFSPSRHVFRGPVHACRVFERSRAYLAECDECDIDSIGKLINHGNESGVTALNHFAVRGMTNHARLLLAHGALVDLGDETVPLLGAVQSNSHRVIELLLQFGARTDIKDMEGMNVLHITGLLGDLETMNIFINSKITVAGYNDRDDYGHTPCKLISQMRSIPRFKLIGNLIKRKYISEVHNGAFVLETVTLLSTNSTLVKHRQ